MRAFLRRNELGVEPVLELTLAPDALGAVALPHTVVLDADGRVVLRHRGAADWNTSEVTALLEHLAATASAAGPVSIYRGSVELSVGAPPPGARGLEISWALCRDDLCVPGRTTVPVGRR